MCNFVSAILTQHHVLLGWSEDQSKMDRHLTILEAWKIDDGLHSGDFVKIEILPKNKPISDFANWRFVVDQDTTPDWFHPKSDELRVREAILASGILGIWAEYKKVNGPAWAEYEKVNGPAWAEYEKVNGQALAEYSFKRKEIAARKW